MTMHAAWLLKRYVLTYERLIYFDKLLARLYFRIFRADRTMTGHALGQPNARPESLAPERNLSSVVVGIIRVLMHCALIEGAFCQPQVCSSWTLDRISHVPFFGIMPIEDCFVA